MSRKPSKLVTSQPVVPKYELTDEHRAQLGPWHKRWVDIAMRTDPQTDEDRAAMVTAVRGLYEAAELPQPLNIVFVPSPLVGQVAAGFAAALWHLHDKTPLALREQGFCGNYDITESTRTSISPKTGIEVDDSTNSPRFHHVRDATKEATREATSSNVQQAMSHRGKEWERTADNISRGARVEAAPRRFDSDNDTVFFASTDATRDATAQIDDPTGIEVHHAMEAIFATNGPIGDIRNDAAFPRTVSTRDAVAEATRDAVGPNVPRRDVESKMWDSTVTAARKTSDVSKGVATPPSGMVYHATREATRSATSIATSADVRVDTERVEINMEDNIFEATVNNEEVADATIHAPDLIDVRNTNLTNDIYFDTLRATALGSSAPKDTKRTAIEQATSAAVSGTTSYSAFYPMWNATMRQTEVDLSAPTSVSEQPIIAGVADAVLHATSLSLDTHNAVSAELASEAFEHGDRLDEQDFESIRPATQEATTAATSNEPDNVYEATYVGPRYPNEKQRNALWREIDLSIDRDSNNEVFLDMKDRTFAVVDEPSDSTHSGVFESVAHALSDEPPPRGWARRMAASVFPEATDLMCSCAESALNMYAGGNLWAAGVDFISFFRHVAKLPLDYSKWQHYEEAAIHGGWRFMHPKFCIVVDFPERLLIDDQNRPHCADGPSHRWRDGFSIWHWHGVRLDDEHRWIIQHRERITKETILGESNSELRRVMCEVVGWGKAIEMLGGRTVATDTLHGQAREVMGVELGLGDIARVIRLRNGTVEPDGTRHEFIEGIPLDVSTPHEAEAWAYGIAPKHYREAVRT